MGKLSIICSEYKVCSTPEIPGKLVEKQVFPLYSWNSPEMVEINSILQESIYRLAKFLIYNCFYFKNSFKKKNSKVFAGFLCYSPRKGRETWQFLWG